MTGLALAAFDSRRRRRIEAALDERDREQQLGLHVRRRRALGGGDVLECFVPGHPEVIADVFAGRPVISVMPTGAGKSLCYQLPAIVLGERGGVTLVVSPLIALMKDQVDVLRARGVAAVALTSAAGADEQRDI